MDELERAAFEAGRERDRALKGRAVQRERGVVHTPPAVARWLARRAHHALQVDLGVALGLGDPALRIVDPACGPGAFLAAILATTIDLRSEILALDVDGEAIATAETVLGPAFDARGARASFLVGDTLSRLSLIAAQEGPLLAIGNPPWSARTANADAREADALLDDFRREPDGAPLAERKLGVLADDYVRFFRFVAEMARHARGGAVLALATNGSFLDGPVHRGMRAALLRWFDRLEIVDLGGNAMVARRSDRDDNVFGVRPSAVLTIAVRRPDAAEPRRGQVGYTRLRGARDAKLAALDADEVGLEPLEPRAPWFLFARRESDARYDALVSLADAMPFHREGVQTNRDDAAIAPTREALLARLRAFVDRADDPALAGARRRSRHYDPDRAREAVAAALERDPDGRLGIAARPIAYRPMQSLWLAPIAPFCHRQRPDLLAAFDRAPLALVTVRKDRGERPWAHFGAVRAVPDNCFLSTRSSCRARAFPLRTPEGALNVSADVIEALACLDRDADAFLFYALATIAAPSYRTQNEDALRLDYPRIPMPIDGAAYDAKVEVGREIAAAFDSAPTPQPRPFGRGGMSEPDGVVIGHWTIRHPTLARLVND